MIKGSRWRNFYGRWVLGWPKTTIAILFICLGMSAYGLKDFRLDASGDALVLENDEDMRYYRKLIERYKSGDFVVITYSPPEELFSMDSLAWLKKVRDELIQLQRVSSIVTILDVPLFKNKPGNLKELKDNIRTLESPKIDLQRAIEEFRDSPIYQNMLVSEDMRSSAIQVNFKTDSSHEIMLSRRLKLIEKKYEKTLTVQERNELDTIEDEYRRYKDEERTARHQDIQDIRRIIGAYRSKAGFILGGVPMIVDDIITYVKNDLKVFGVGMFLLLVGTLYVMFRRIRWIVLPLACCFFSVFVMLGLLGLAHWDVTVVSSNFVSLQLILTLSLAIHIVVRYTELLGLRPQASNREVMRDAVCDVFVPSLYCQLTTIAGFSSLMFCGILPVMNFGWMMTMGLGVSLVITHLFLPAAAVLLPRPPATFVEMKFGTPFTSFCARMVQGYRGWILAAGAILTFVTVIGCLRLEVENSFINYFKSSTEIFRGMKFIDRNLGGTTPLEITLDFQEQPVSTSPALSGPGPGTAKSGTASPDDEFDKFREFEEEQTSKKYGFTTSKLELVEKVHDYLDAQPETGKVLSLATVWKTARSINEGKELDDFSAAILFNSLKGRDRELLVDPYVFTQNDQIRQIRITTRIKDSLPDIRRDALLKRIHGDLVKKVGLSEGQFRLAGLMVLYNNMLRSLFDSQIKTIGYTVLALTTMFLILLRSWKIALVAILPNLLATMSILGVMGIMDIPLDVMTITIVAISMGIAVDDTIHYLHRFHREILLDWDYPAAMRRCHGTIGNGMYYTSVPIILGFSILGLSNFVPSILFGLFVALAMIVALWSNLNLLPSLVLVFKPYGRGLSTQAQRSGSDGKGLRDPH
ncbi:MAG: MMPL family transporter [Methanomassiliicoccales archaeon]|nr:MMPL family transporter [Methanomassiliicoccales archaeon]